MVNVIKPEQFRERFTLRLNAEGEPVERPLRAMTAGEVLAAPAWHGCEARPGPRQGKQEAAGDRGPGGHGHAI